MNACIAKLHNLSNINVHIGWECFGEVLKYWRQADNLFDVNDNRHNGAFKIYNLYIWRSTTSILKKLVNCGNFLFIKDFIFWS